jgi:hypothetical protein
MAGRPAARPGDANRDMLACLLAGRPAVQLRDLAEEAGLGRDYYDESRIYMELHHAERLLDAGYRPVVVPALSGAVNVILFVRGPWPVDASVAAPDPAMRPYLADGDPLMALLVGRAQRATSRAAGH